ncbi:MAG TPA: transketolase [Pseudomonadota bacterium]|nr:transketolase [Pseudomonadota bacterium]
MTVQVDKDLLCINTIRTLAMDAVQEAKSGHPGTPMGLAPVAYYLWQNLLRFDPDDPIWPNRDRFVLSCGHASMLLYSLLHLAKVKAVNPKYEVQGKLSVELDDIKRFRQTDSRCAGHPEYRWTSGVETTTGPLGQGVATSVGMAIASRWMASYFNRPGFDIMGYNVYAVAGDGCMMEGVSYEAASLAGHLGLSNLCWVWDNNRITIEGSTDVAFTEDVATRFIAAGWAVMRVGDANDLTMLGRAFNFFHKVADRPTLIIVDSHIAYGSPNKQDHHSAHGEPLGWDEIKATKKAYNWPDCDAKFLVPEGVHEHIAGGLGARGKKLRSEWIEMFDRYKKEYPELAQQLHQMQTRQLPEGWDKEIPTFPADAKGVAGRDASAKVLNAIAKNVPWLVGGSADLAPSTKTRLTFNGAGDMQRDEPGGRNMHFGVREHAMTSILNGLSLSKIRPYGSQFMIFSDYARAPIRLSAIMEIPCIFIFTHDSIGVGEDGPTHQPIEQLASMRAIPGILVLRPGDANEVSDAWRVIMKQKHEPAILILSRQPMRTIDRTVYNPSQVERGAYVVTKDENPDVILMGTGSEVELCLEASEHLAKEGITARVVSMPSWELFEKQDAEYRNKVLPRNQRARVAVEKASTFGWARYVGLDGAIVGMETFGASAPLAELQKKFGFTVENVVKKAKAQIAQNCADKGKE